MWIYAKIATISCIILPFLLVRGDGKTGGGTTFKKCSSLSLSSSAELCFDTKIDKIDVKVGNVGTDDDVRITICSDFDKDNCCTTPVLKTLLSDDWSKNDRETWKRKSLGQCGSTIFKLKQKLSVTLTKNGNGPLEVESIDVDSKVGNKTVHEIERFKCGPYSIGGSQVSSQAKDCPTGPYHYMEIEKAVFQIGTDGTDDDVKVKIASDTNSVACETKLSRKLSDDWRRNKLETWLRSNFKSCKNVPYKVTNAPIFSVTKDGKDDLVVTSSTFYMRQRDANRTTKYACGGFTLSGTCTTSSLCRHTFTNCRPSIVAGTSSDGRTTRRPTTRTTRRPTGTTSATTKRSILSSILG